MKRRSGFTIIELLMTFVILGILAGIAIPTFAVWMPNYRLRAAANEVYSSFQRAKMEAIRRNEVVVIRFNVANDSYEVFVDNGSGGGTAGDGVRNGTEPLIHSVTLHENVQIHSASFSGSPACGFSPRGLAWNSRIGNVEIRNQKNRQHSIILSMAGNVRME